MPLPEIGAKRRNTLWSLASGRPECYEDSTSMNILHAGLGIISCYPTQICKILSEKECKLHAICVKVYVKNIHKHFPRRSS